MYGLPDGVNLTFFVGQELQQACFGGATLILNFDRDAKVTITSSVGCLDSSGTIKQYANFLDVATTVLALLEQKIVSAEGDSAGTLLLKFDGGGFLAIYDDSEQYESYIIKHGEDTIIV